MVFIDACLTGTDNSFNVFLYPYYNGYNTSWCENQALVGWRISVRVDKTQACAAAFWIGLADGLTVHQARDQMVAEYFYPEPVPGPGSDYASVWGDYYTRLNGAYTGSDDYAPHFWW